MFRHMSKDHRAGRSSFLGLPFVPFGARCKRETEVDVLWQISDGLKDLARGVGSLHKDSATDVFKYFVLLSAEEYPGSKSGRDTFFLMATLGNLRMSRSCRLSVARGL